MLSRTTRRVVKRIGGQMGLVFDGVPSTELGADQVDQPTAESVVAVAGVVFTPARVTDSLKGAGQILLLPGPSKPTREGTGFGSEDDESLEGLVSLEEMGGVTKAVTIAFSQAPTPSLTPSQPPQPVDPKDSSPCRRVGATRDEETVSPSSTI